MSADIINRVMAKRKQVFYGWWVVLAGFLINAFGIGTFFYGFSTFFKPLEREFGWSRTIIAGVTSLSRLEGGLEGPVAGWLTDKFGARKMMFFGIPIAAIGFILLSRINSPLALYLTFGILLSLGFQLGYTHATQAAVAKWFIKKRSFAFSILMTGNGVGGALLVPTIARLIAKLGWRTAANVIGIATLAIPLPLSLFVRSTPEDLGLKPDGESTKQEGPSSAEEYTPSSSDSATSEEVNLTVREALKTRAFWVYVASMAFRSCILSSLVVHQIPHLTDIGIPEETAADVLGLMVALSIPGRFVFGWLGDKFNKKVLLFLLCSLQAVGIFIFVNASTLPLLYLFVVVYGLGYGGVIPLTTALRADLFGRSNYATIAGITMSIGTVGTVLGPLFAGYLYDTTQSYSLAFYIFMVMILISGVLFLLIPRTSQPVRNI